MDLVSYSEKSWILEGFAHNARNEGRKRDEYRHIQVSTGIVTSATGSAQVRLGSTDVIVGVKCELGPPDAARPNAGRVVLSVECSPLASPEFKGRGGDDLAASLTRSLESLLYPAGPGKEGPLDFESLCILPRKTCWIVHVDALVINMDGNLADALALACRAALSNTRIPKVEIITGEDADEEPELELDDDPARCLSLNLARWPVLVTVGRAGPCYVVDCDPLEEQCLSAQLQCVVDPQGQICGTSLASREGLEPGALLEMMAVARAVGPRLVTALDKLLGLRGER